MPRRLFVSGPRAAGTVTWDLPVTILNVLVGLELLTQQSKSQDASCLPTLKVSDIEPTLPVTELAVALTGQCKLSLGILAGRGLRGHFSGRRSRATYSSQAPPEHQPHPALPACRWPPPSRPWTSVCLCLGGASACFPSGRHVRCWARLLGWGKHSFHGRQVLAHADYPAPGFWLLKCRSRRTRCCRALRTRAAGCQHFSPGHRLPLV